MALSDYIQVNALNDKEFERCVVCHELTHVRKDKDISERSFYVEGVGQLCEDCYKELYAKKKKKDKHS